MITLGIETSCDETAVCILETKGGVDSDTTALEYRVLSHLVHSQIAIHAKYGGVFPMMAKREHAKRLVPLLLKAIEESGIGTERLEASKESLENIKKICGDHDEELGRSMVNSSLVKEKPAIDQIVVTHGPGLEPALWVGINFANSLSSLWNIPTIPVNHMEGHIAASFLQNTETKQAFQRLTGCSFPAIAFLASGGHTEIVYIKKIGDYKILGATRDDAIGEAFDKVARMLGLPYPGGPEISKLAEEERDVTAVESSVSSAVNATPHITLPRPMIDADTLDMSFAGLKTAVLYELRKHEGIDDKLKKEVAREFEDAVTDVVLAKLERAFDNNEAYALIVGGGVFANKHILEACKKFSSGRGIAFMPPASGLSGDNALMIAVAGILNDKKNGDKISASGNLSL